MMPAMVGRAARPLFAIGILLGLACNRGPLAFPQPDAGRGREDARGGRDSDASLGHERDGGVVREDARAPDAPMTADAESGPRPPDAAMDARTFSACAPTGMLVAGQERLVGMFVVRAGIIVVTDASVLLVDRGRQPLVSLRWPRAITGAAFDGAHLAIADLETLTVLTPALEVERTIGLEVPCAGAVIVDGARFVCRVSAGDRAAYRTFDLVAGKTLATTMIEWPYGASPQAVRGSPLFVTADPIIVHRVNADGTIADIGRAPDGPRAPFAILDGDPTALVTGVGALLSLPAGGAGDGGPAPDVLARAGVLGTLWHDQSFAALGSAGSRELLALVTQPRDLGRPDLPCFDGCRVQRIDVNHKLVISEQAQALRTAKRILALAADDDCGMAVVGYALTGGAEPDREETGYRVDLLAYDGAPVPPVRAQAGDAGAPDAAEAQPSVEPPSVTCARGQIASGGAELIELFVHGSDLLLVREDGLLRLGRDGAARGFSPWPRQIVAAALDRTRPDGPLVVVDRAMATVLTPAVDVAARWPLAEPCVAVDIVGGSMVCDTGQTAMGATAYYAHELPTGDVRGRVNPGSPDVHHGLRAVPGHGTYFVTTPRLGLGHLSGDGTIAFPGGSDLYLQDTFAFAGRPLATQVIDSWGRKLRIFGTGCDGMSGDGPAGCNAADGDLGLLACGEQYVALTDEGDDGLFAVVNSAIDRNNGYLCRLGGGCRVQRIDLRAGRVADERTQPLDVARFLFARHDPVCGTLAVAYERLHISPDDPPGSLYRLDVLDYRGPGAL
jgi:hypothetical protein